MRNCKPTNRQRCRTSAYCFFLFLIFLQLCSRVAHSLCACMYLCLCGAAFSRRTMKIAATMSLNFHAASSIIMYAPDRAFMIGPRKPKNRFTTSPSPIIITVIKHNPNPSPGPGFQLVITKQKHKQVTEHQNQGELNPSRAIIIILLRFLGSISSGCIYRSDQKFSLATTRL